MTAALEAPPIVLDLEGTAAPTFAPARDPRYSSAGARVAVVADALGTPLMPWQRLVADVATERLEDGAYRWPVVVVTVPRQSGKTTLMRAVGVERAISRPETPVFYTAQTGKDARERWRDLVKQLRSSPLRSQITIREAAGSERVIFPNGSEFRCFAPLGSALHGYTPPAVMLDEVWAHDEARGDELMGAIVPAQITIRHRQIWLVSTAGTADSGFLRRWVEAGRAGAEGVALFEWAAPADADPFAPATWREFHPALGWVRPDGTPQLTEDDLRRAADLNSRAEFERAYLNRWTVTAAVLIPRETWRDLGPLDDTPPAEVDAAGVTLSYDVAHDRKSAAILATWPTAAGVESRVVMADEGVGWLVPALEDLIGKRRPLNLAADDGGPTRQVTDAILRSTVIRDAGLTPKILSPREFAMATGAALSRIDAGTWRHDGSSVLEDAAAAVVTRPMSDGVIVSRRHSAGPVAAFVAGVVGAWVAGRPDEVDAEVVIRFAS